MPKEGPLGPGNCNGRMPATVLTAEASAGPKRCICQTRGRREVVEGPEPTNFIQFRICSTSQVQVIVEGGKSTRAIAAA